MSSTKIVLIGAGSVKFTQGLLADIMLSDFCDEWTVALVDINPEALEVAHGLAKRMLQVRPAPVRLEASTDRRDVLEGADVVVTTIGVGGRRAWETDVFVPREHGIYQPVGDSVMAGGLSRALRQIPPMVEIARDVLALAPGARFYNYANPMTAICRAVQLATGAELVGLCHGVMGSLRDIADLLELNDADLVGLTVGVNHLTFLLNLRWRGQDAWPLLKQLGGVELTEADKRQLAVLAQMGASCQAVGAMREQHPFSWELFDLYGALPLVGDCHVCEFFPALFRNGSYYGKTLGVDVHSFEAIIERDDRNYEQMVRRARGEEPIDESLFDRAPGEHEQLLDIIKSVLADEGRIFSANVPNNGAVANVADEMVLEVPCVFQATGAYPLAIGEVPAWLAGILAQRHCVTELTVQAALNGCAKTFAQALLAEGMADSIAAAQRLADDLIKAQAEYLPQFA